MADSPAKRRKTSPTTSVPIDAPATPSRIPVPIERQSGAKTTPARRPSFLSPTKASISRHNPQLLKRPSSSGAGAERPGSRGRNLDDVFAKVLGETRPAVGGPSLMSGEDRDGTKSTSTTVENEPRELDPPFQSQRSRPTTPKSRSKPIGGRLSAKPKRLSRSPTKRPERAIEYSVPDPAQLPDDFNPFQKKGLKRSPVPGQVDNPVAHTIDQDIENPFRKTGLRRSPIFSRPVEGNEQKSPVPEQDPPRSERASSIIEQRMWNSQDIRPSSQLQQEESQASNTPTEPNIPQMGAQPVLEEQVSKSPTEPENLSAKDVDVDKEPTPPPPPVVENVMENVVEAAPTREPRPPQEQRTGGNEEHELTREFETLVRPATQRRVARVFEDPLAPFGGAPIPEEPDLPPTPKQLGLDDPIVTTPPSGIHDTPSKRARRTRALGEKLKSSPLKPKDPRPEELKPEQMLPKSIRVPENKTEQVVKRRKSARFFIPEDPHAAKRKERDGLLKELQQLQADIALANQEHERLRIRSESKKKIAPPGPNPNELMSMLSRATASEQPVKETQRPTSIFKSINAFLPFRSRRRPTVAPAPEKPLPSHLPIPLDDPLPYLQAFSSLTFSSAVTILPAEPVSSGTSSQEVDQPIMQRHVIKAIHPSGLFSTRFSMTVDTSALTVSSLEILRLDMNAEKELGTFIRARARAEGPLGKDPTIICWAMSRWIEVSIQRARFWCVIEKEFGTSEARTQTSQLTRKRKRHAGKENTADVIDPIEGETGKWTRRQLLPHIGRTAMELVNKEVELRFEWKLGFDWTGEVESTIAANARLPRTWQKADDRNSLSKVPETFDRMAKERGPLNAVRAVVALLMPAS